MGRELDLSRQGSETEVARVRREVLVRLIRNAIAYAEVVRPEPASAYWIDVTTLCNEIATGLRKRQDTRELRLAARELAWSIKVGRHERHAHTRAIAAALDTAMAASRGDLSDAAEAAVTAAIQASWAQGTGPGPAKVAEAAAWAETAVLLIQSVSDQPQSRYLQSSWPSSVLHLSDRASRQL